MQIKTPEKITEWKERLKQAFEDDPGTVASSAVETLGILFSIGSTASGDADGGKNVALGSLVAGNALNLAVQSVQAIKRGGEGWTDDVSDFILRSLPGFSFFGFKEILDTSNHPALYESIALIVAEIFATLKAVDFKTVKTALRAARRENASLFERYNGSDEAMRDARDLLQAGLETLNANIDENTAFLGKAPLED